MTQHWAVYKETTNHADHPNESRSLRALRDSVVNIPAELETANPRLQKLIVLF